MGEKKTRILVIDDLPSEAKIITIILEQAGYEVMSVYSGKEGIEKALQEDFDIVVTDMMMPDIGGMRVLRDIKKVKPSLPVVIMSGYASIKAAMQAMRLDAAHFFEKGFTPLELIAEVESALFKAKKHTIKKTSLIHRETIIEIIERAARDPVFTSELLHNGAAVIDSYNLTDVEKLALLTGDIEWIETHIGKLSCAQKMWLEHREQSELWY